MAHLVLGADLEPRNASGGNGLRHLHRLVHGPKHRAVEEVAEAGPGQGANRSAGGPGLGAGPAEPAGCAEHQHRQGRGRGRAQHTHAYGKAAQAGQKARPAALDDFALPDRQAPGLAFPEPAIELLGLRDVRAIGLAAHRHVALDLAPAADWRHVREHPVEIPVLAPVLDHAGPGQPLLQRVPHVGKGLGRHVGVPDHVVRLADELRHGVAAGGHEGRVDVGDAPFQVGARHQCCVVVEQVFVGGDG
ncbi:hypothetical protein VPARA_68170 [Variovorax paradoxus]|uniref:Uncharacterized protein n=1 Tax=Variovorax paradoxus TaxID=34073 RepID=A0A0H2LQV8_VARPD|nr:hypothetical protein VPARA_68170 [Variovorax paradoxus]